MPDHYGHSDQRGKKSAQYHAKKALVPVVRYHNVAISGVVNRVLGTLTPRPLPQEEGAKPGGSAVG